MTGEWHMKMIDHQMCWKLTKNNNSITLKQLGILAEESTALKEGGGKLRINRTNWFQTVECLWEENQFHAAQIMDWIIEV